MKINPAFPSITASARGNVMYLTDRIDREALR